MLVLVFLFLLFRARVPGSRIRDRCLIIHWMVDYVLLRELLLEACI